MDVIAIIARYRIEKRYSFAALAKEIGISNVTLYRWIKGKHSPYDYMLIPVKRYIAEHIDEIALTLKMIPDEIRQALEN